MTPARVASLLERNGQSVTIARKTTGAYNPATGTGTDSTVTKTVKAALLPLAYTRKTGENGVVAGDETLLVATLDTSGAALAQPKPGSVVTLADGSTKYTLIAVETIRPDGTERLHDCVVRRAG